MIYRYKLNSITFINSLHKNTNYGADLQLLISKYKNKDDIIVDNRILFKASVNDILDRTGVLSILSIDKIVLKLYHSLSFFYDNTVNIKVNKINSNWAVGCGKQVSPNKLYGVTWLKRDISNNWINPGGDYTELEYLYLTGLLLALDITDIIKSDLTYGYMLMIELLSGLINFYSKNTNNTLLRPVLDVYFNDSVRIINLLLLVLDTTKQHDIIISNITHKYKTDLIVQFKVLCRYNFEFKQWGVLYYLQDVIALPDNACYLLMCLDIVVIPRDLTYTRISFNLYNYFLLPMNTLLVGKVYNFNIYINNRYYNIPYTFRVTL